MELNAVTRSVGDIFSVNKKYIVPRFQREYSWTKEEIDEFWDDIIQQIKLNGKKPENEEYFIGCIVLVGEDSKQDYLIVDGQQRLTTLTILIRAIVERLKELNDLTAANALYQNIIEGTDNDGKKYFKLVNENPKPYFQNEIQVYQPLGLSTARTDEEKLLTAAFNGFLKRLNTLSIHGLNESESIKILRTQVLNFLKFILVTAKNEDDAYTIFETLNARGLSLTSVDLIKNWIFKNDKETHPNDNAKAIWDELRKEITEFSDLETFFRHYWNSKYAYASNDRLYKSFNEFLKKGRIESARKFLLELKNASKRYRKIGVPKEKDWNTQKEKAVVQHLELINQYKVTQVRPVLLALLECRENKNIDETLFIKIIQNLENFHFIFSNICQSRASGLEGTYTSAAKELYLAGKDKTKVRKVIIELDTSLRLKIPNFQLLSDSLEKLVFTNGNETNKKTIQTIFIKIEQYLQQTAELKVGNFSLEHIENQSTNKDWVGKIGNIIPVDEKLNNSIKHNASFKDKKIIYKKSEFKIIKKFLEVIAEDTWDKSSSDKWLKEIATNLHQATSLQTI
jgi:uncharacterized protein with ParB-like and HNH nuclease domain